VTVRGGEARLERGYRPHEDGELGRPGGELVHSLSGADTASDAEVLRDEGNLVRGQNLDTQLTHLDDRT
jgi:hypothetical protein